MNVIKEIERINANEFASGIIGGIVKGSWHEKYRDSAWVYVGGMTFELSEGDILCVMSQWGEVEDINLVRDKATNKSLGYAFVKYEDQRSTILAVDNFNGIKLLGRTLRCDHVDKYKLSKDVRKREEDKLDDDPDAEPDVGPGHAYNDQEMANAYSISSGIDVWAPVRSQQPSSSSRKVDADIYDDKKHDREGKKNSKKEKKVKKHSKDPKDSHKRKHDRRSSERKTDDSRNEKTSVRHREDVSSDRDRKRDRDREREDNMKVESVRPISVPANNSSSAAAMKSTFSSGTALFALRLDS